MIEALASPLVHLVVLALAIHGAGAAALACERWLVGSGRKRLDRDDPARRTAPWVVGFGLWSLVLFGLATGGWLRPAALAGLVWAVAILRLVAVIVAVRGRGPQPLASRFRGLCRVARRPFTWALGLFLLPVLAVTANPTVSWDAAVYHLALPALYLDAGGFREVPFLVYAVWPQALDLLWGAALAVDGYRLAKLAHFGCGVLLLVWVARAVRRDHPDGHPAQRWVGGLAAGLVLIHGVVITELRAAYVDLGLACLVFALHLLVERALTAGTVTGAARRWWLLAGIAAGGAAGIKVTGLAYAACVVMAAVPSAAVAAIRAGGLRRLSGPALVFCVPVLVLWTPWLVHAARWTGNPVYPLAWDVLGGPHWSAEVARQLSDWHRSIGMGRAPIDYLLLPWRVLVHGDLGYSRFDGRLWAGWVVLLPLAFLRLGSCPRTRRRLGGAALFFAFWATTSQQMRFLIPILPLLAVAIADAAGHLAARWIERGPRPRTRRRAVSWGVVLAWSTAALWAHGPLLGSGVRHLALYADPAFEMPARAPAPAGYELLDTLPDDAVVLLLNTNRIFFCARPCLADSFFEASQIGDWLGRAADPRGIHRLLRAAGVTHILWTGRPTGVRYPDVLGAFLQGPHAAIVHRDQAAGVTLWRVEP